MKRNNTMGNILVVDDDPVALQFVKVILKNEGYQVTLANDGREALQKLKEEHFDIVISDVNMPPGMSGFQLVETIRLRNPLKKISILFLTGLREKIDVLRGMELGIDDYLIKPINPSLLLSKIKNLLCQTENKTPEIHFAQT